eukprot:CAMPEP_0184865172 /NCGR_PEP_ID=MMETSP0580-20130426/17205_1 /TAXON_ID=1118495 /ORGANISM="Dactyliosolen fragilissimus" /LENGTH=318 /DNA_ID=CAMNT_0027364267 /DNA_START=1 /DNA_END=957 /DNA_ORIENTATION=+
MSSPIRYLSREIIITACCVVSLLFMYVNTNVDLTGMLLDQRRNLYTKRDGENILRLQYKSDSGCISRVNKLIYVHIPKTGGTTFERSPLFNDARKHRVVGGHDHLSAMTKDSDLRSLNGFTSATTIRHPCDRFISAFNYLSSRKGNRVDTSWADAHIGNYTIDEFVMNQEKKGFHDMRNWIHFKKQHLFVLNEGDVDIDIVMCQEEWEEGVRRLFQALGKEIIPSYFMDTFNTTSKEGHSLKLNHRKCSDLKDSTRRAIERYYALDYCLFEYPSLLTNTTKHTCVGADMTKQDLNAKFKACKKMLAVFTNTLTSASTS